MSCASAADKTCVGNWLFFTNHLHVLSTLAKRPDLRLREIAQEVGITERATHRIITELIEAGYVRRTRVGSRNHYEVNPDAPLRHARQANRTTAHLLRFLTGGDQATDAPASSGLAESQRGSADDPDLYRAAFADAPTGIAVADPGGRLLAVNQTFCELLQHGEDELIGQQLRAFIHPADISAYEQGVRELTDGESSEYVAEKRYILPSGATRWVRVRVTAGTHPRTGGRTLIAHADDITDRKQKQEALAEAEERFRSAFDNAPIGMALVAPDGRFIKVNRALCELTGYAETALLVRTFQDITHPDDLDADLAYVEDVLAGRRRTYQMEKRYYHADGHVIWVMLSVSMVRDDSGKPLYFISQIEDISERKRREQSGGAEHAEVAADRVAADHDRRPVVVSGPLREWDFGAELA